jgi:dTDP-4-amino-4,6-dideoxygalactose transaminase
MADALNVPFHRPSIGQDEIDEVTNTLKSGWLTTGPRTAQFETEFRNYVGVPHALAVNSCTAGLHLALKALRIGPGTEIITSPLTFCATVNVILHSGATPVLADVGPEGNIDPISIVSRITEKTRAIMPVHFAGLPAEMDRIWNIARRFGLHVIEDCAHAVGAQYKGWPIGAGDPERGDWSEACVFSFYATKNLTTGEGGMVTTHDADLLDRMKMLCLHGISKDAWNRYSDSGNWYYEVMEAGFKYNLSDILSAIGIHQLRKIETFTAIRSQYARLYNKLFEGIEELETPCERADSRHAWHLYSLRLNLNRLSINRAEFIKLLHQRGVGTSVHFIPIPLHPYFSTEAQLPHNNCPNALDLYPRLLSLPLYPAMTEEQVRYVADSVKHIAHKCRKLKTFAMGAPV